MKNKILFFAWMISIPFILFSMNGFTSKDFTLNGKIKNLDSGILVLSYMTKTQPIFDTVMIKNGEFIVKGKISEPTQANIVINGHLATVIYLEAGSLKIELVNNEFERFEMTGSNTQNEMFALNKQINPIDELRDNLKYRKSSILDTLKNVKDTNRIRLLKKEINSISAQWDNKRNQVDSIKLNFVKIHPESYISSDFLLIFAMNDVISLDSLKTLYNHLSYNIQNSIPGNEIKEDIFKKEKNVVGHDAPNFTFTDKNNQIRSLSEFKGKCVIIDVWASWCIPCRNTFPHLRTLFEQYHTKGLEIISISCDQNKDNWKKAIQEDHIENWQHSIIGMNKLTTETAFYKNYHFQAIPHLFLIDKNGKIAGNWVGSSDEKSKTLEVALKEIFK